MRNMHKHPLIFLRGLKGSELEAILDFVYLGHTQVYNAKCVVFGDDKCYNEELTHPGEECNNVYRFWGFANDDAS